MGKRDKTAGKWYNCSVQVAAERTISYTVKCVIGVEPLPPADGVFVWSSGQMKTIDETGNRYGRLTVVCRAGSTKNGEAMWLCLCDCGNESIVRGTKLRRMETRSCGCLEQETRVLNGNRRMIPTHGMSSSRLYGVWSGMKKRCNNPSHPHYKDYGGRGISVCNEWDKDFYTFAAWALSHGYDENAAKGQCTLDRIDSDGDYCPENCRFADMVVQQNNRRDRSNDVQIYLGQDGVYHASPNCGRMVVDA